MKIEVSGEFYTFSVTVDGRLALLELSGGWWQVTDGTGGQIIPPFRKKDNIDAIAIVAKHLRDEKK